VARGYLDVRSVVLMRRCDVHHLDRRIGAQILDRCTGTSTKIRGKALRRFVARVGRGDQCDTRVGRKRRQHQRKRAPQSDHTHAQTAVAHRGLTMCSTQQHGIVFGPLATLDIDV
jgi:hypothetical protein